MTATLAATFAFVINSRLSHLLITKQVIVYTNTETGSSTLTNELIIRSMKLIATTTKYKKLIRD